MLPTGGGYCCGRVYLRLCAGCIAVAASFDFDATTLAADTAPLLCLLRLLRLLCLLCGQEEERQQAELKAEEEAEAQELEGALQLSMQLVSGCG